MTLCFPRALATNCVCLHQSVFYLACLSIAFTPHVVRAHVHVLRCVCVCVCVRVGLPSRAQCTPKSAPSRAQCPFFFVFFLKSASVMQHLGLDENQKKKKCGLSPYFAQSRGELRSCQVLSFLHNSEKVIFRFGPAVRSTGDISSYKVYIVLDNIIGIQKSHICAYVTLHHNELHRFESTMFFSSVIRLLLVFFRAHQVQ